LAPAPAASVSRHHAILGGSKWSPARFRFWAPSRVGELMMQTSYPRLNVTCSGLSGSGKSPGAVPTGATV
jgi:hypothetical protein